MVNQLLPGVGYLVIMSGSAEIHNEEAIINASIEALNCPYGLLSDSDIIVNELVDRVRTGYILIIKRIRKPLRNPLKLGLNYRDYEAQLTRPVIVWLALPGPKPVRLGKLDKPIIGFRGRACQASALVINKVLNELGITSVSVA